MNFNLFPSLTPFGNWGMPPRPPPHPPRKKYSKNGKEPVETDQLGQHQELCTYILSFFVFGWFVFHGPHGCWGASIPARDVHSVGALSIHLTGKFDISYSQSFALIFLHKLFHLFYLFGRQLMTLWRVLVMCRELLCQLFLSVLCPLWACHWLLLLGQHLHVLPGLNHKETRVNWEVPWSSDKQYFITHTRSKLRKKGVLSIHNSLYNINILRY